MYKIAYTKKKRVGRCTLCFKDDEHLERHHLRYEPEITTMLCHECHFQIHYFPERLKPIKKKIMLMRVMPHDELDNWLLKHGDDRVALAKKIAPSQRVARLQKLSV